MKHDGSIKGNIAISYILGQKSDSQCTIAINRGCNANTRECKIGQGSCSKNDNKCKDGLICSREARKGCASDLKHCPNMYCCIGNCFYTTLAGCIVSATMVSTD